MCYFINMHIFVQKYILLLGYTWHTLIYVLPKSTWLITFPAAVRLSKRKVISPQKNWFLKPDETLEFCISKLVVFTLKYILFFMDVNIISEKTYIKMGLTVLTSH